MSQLSIMKQAFCKSQTQCIIYKAILLKLLEMFVSEVSESFKIHVSILSSAQSFPWNTNACKFSFPYMQEVFKRRWVFLTFFHLICKLSTLVFSLPFLNAKKKKRIPINQWKHFQELDWHKTPYLAGHYIIFMRCCMHPLIPQQMNCTANKLAVLD